MKAFEGRYGVISFDPLAKTDDYMKFIIHGKVAIRINAKEVLKGAVRDKTFENKIKKEAVLQLNNLIKELENYLTLEHLVEK